MIETDLIPVLQDIKKVIDFYHIKCWLDQGILLGAVRDKAAIPHDTDVDLGIMLKDSVKVIEAVPMLKELGFEVWLHVCNLVFVKNKIVITFLVYQDTPENLYLNIDYPFVNRTDAKLTEKMQPIQRFYDIACFRELQTKHERKIDCRAYKISRFKLVRWLIKKHTLALWKYFGGEYFGYVTPKHFYDTLDEITFYDMLWNIPSSVEDYLQFKYGKNWRTPCGANVWDIYRDDGAIIYHDEIVKRFKSWKTCEDVWKSR